MIKRVLRDLMPPVVLRTVRRLRSGSEREQVCFRGDFARWEDAARVSDGYDNPDILARTRAAMLKVKNGEAAFERDSVVFEKMEYSYPLLAGLLRTSVQFERLSVLDFGGSLGSSYYQCRTFLSIVARLKWSIVEQPAHVECGRRDFANEQLRFYESIEDCICTESPNLLLMSGVLQCLPSPHDTLGTLLRHNIPHVIIDRTAFIEGTSERLTVETVPDWIYRATYPSWFLNESRLLATCHDSGYELVADFPALDDIPISSGSSYFKGFMFEKSTT